MFNIFIADDHSILREGLKLILSKRDDCTIAGEAHDGNDVFDSVDRLRPDILLLDISMPGKNGVEIAGLIKEKIPSVKIIILSQYDNIEYIRELIYLKVDAYILKKDASADLNNAIDAVLRDETYYSTEITNNLVQDYRDLRETAHESTIHNKFKALSPRETEILKLIADGKKNKDIAALLDISDQTVKVHRANIMKKMGVSNLADLIKMAIKEGIFSIQ